MEIKQKKLPKSQIEVEVELTPEEFKKHVDHALSHLKEHVKVDGFRQGHVPENIAKEKIGKENLLMEAGDLAVNDVYKKFVRENNLEPVGQPEVQILKIAEGNPFLFKLTITVLPEIHLPDYKEIAAKIKSKEISVTEEEIQDALNYLQKTRAKFTAENRPAAKKDFVEIVYQNKDVNEGKEVNDRFVLGEGGFMKEFEENVEGMKAGDEKSFKAKFPENSPRKDLAGKEADFKVSMKSVQKMELSEINDEFAKGLGAFDTLVSLKTSIKEGINQEKTEAEKQRMRGEILSKITEQTKFDIPEKMVDYEKDKLFDNMKHQITEHYKLTFQNYLASIKKTEKEIKETFQKDAEKRIRDYLVLKAIGEKEMIQVLPEEIEEEVSKSIKNYSKQQLDKIDIDELKEYTKGVLMNEKIFQILEKYSQDKN